MRAAVAATVVLLATVTTPAVADHQQGHTQPLGPAAVRFGPGFPELLDSEWGFQIGGFGGVSPGAPLEHVPVIFVHGNNVDHADWYPVRDDFIAAGWSEQEMWALSYNGLGTNNGTAYMRQNPERDQEHRDMGSDGITHVTANDVNVPDLVAFVRAVQDYTGSQRFSLVGHSLGVTIARKTLFEHADLRDDLVGFVGIAGGNHGTSLCPPGSEGEVHGCDEIAAGTAWLAELNGPDGSMETYGPARWMTVYDGTGAGDVAFVGPTYAASPELAGADNQAFPGTDHNGLRLDPAIVTVYREFLEEASTAAGGPGPLGTSGQEAADPAPVAQPVVDVDGGTVAGLPATGGGAAAAGILACAGAFWTGRVRRRRRTH